MSGYTYKTKLAENDDNEDVVNIVKQLHFG